VVIRWPEVIYQEANKSRLTPLDACYLTGLTDPFNKIPGERGKEAIFLREQCPERARAPARSVYAV